MLTEIKQLFQSELSEKECKKEEEKLQNSSEEKLHGWKT